ncbi:MAG: DUF3365 domain-containing protein [Gemmatimonadota bacterium]|nr:DUF3365 domain-containing protein [Gemmatimonadota bacterium]MDP6528067.1 DUF3365 domain-containing protein [Gemmatimonadota bacterium]MDP6801547.1 DUF3365 domain-containing protein [Gemmatimonadota bacterium]MDP7030906.1 DUF3365 domain-containing protein [Gemmatimonadota bacterium]
MREVAAATLLLLAVAVARPAAEDDISRGVTHEQMKVRIAREEARVRGVLAADLLTKTLGAELKAAVSSGGPAEAVTVCASRAMALTDSVSAVLGLRIRRVSDRNRNPGGAPNQLERAVLARFSEEGAPADTFFADSAGDWHYLRAIRIEKPLCLKCHGPKEELAEDVRAVLRQDYPEDLATGYRFRELRGAFSVTVPAR